MRVLLFGASGQVGGELLPLLDAVAEVVAPPRTAVDLADLDAVRRAIADAEPDVIVNAAAFNDVDAAEGEEALATRVNGEAPEVMGREAARRGKLLIHYSSDFVFDGRATRPYVESDPPAPLSSYGRSKLAGEERLGAIDAPAIVLRTAWVYGLRRRSFVKTILAAARGREVLRVVADQVGSPTSARELAAATLRLLTGASLEALRSARGVYHLAGEGAASRIELARAALLLDPRRAEHRAREIVPVASAALGPGAARPAHAPLDCARVAARFGVTLPPWREALARELAAA